MASEVKVNKISPASGTAFTMGDSGDTFTVPSGVTLQNNGTADGFGAVDWQTGDIKTSTFTAVAGKGYFVNTTGGAITVNLPAGSAGAQIGLLDYAGTWDTNNCTVAANGSEKIQASTDDAIFSRDREALQIIYVDATQGWVITSVADQGGSQTTYYTASGGTETTSGDYKIHTFDSSGTFTVSSVGNADGGAVSYMVIAGGGGGGATQPSNRGGGGGAGGFRESKTTGDPYTASPAAASGGLALTVQAYPITIGGGGGGGTYPGSNDPAQIGVTGSNSIFSTITSAGGGGGGGGSPPGTGLVFPGASGGSGGGGGGGGSGPGTCARGGGPGNSPPVSPPQGNKGGAGGLHPGNPGSGDQAGGGGGGISARGESAQPGANGGTGAEGLQSSITASPVYYSGGGSADGPGGGGGPVNGGSSPGTNAAANIGAGGGGALNSPLTGANGGSGKVVIRYKYQN